jgi:hypothetical protein
MIPLIINSSIKTGSFANGYGSVRSERWHGIAIEGHRVVRLVVLSSFPPLLGDFVFRVIVFT